MKFHLLDFQRTASEALITEIKKAQARYDNDSELLGAVVLEAATGAGKTVIATSVIEQLIFGSDFTDPGPPPSFGPVAVRVVGFQLMGALPSVVDRCEVSER